MKGKSAEKRENSAAKEENRIGDLCLKYKFKSQGESASEEKDVSEKRKKINGNYTTKLS